MLVHTFGKFAAELDYDLLPPAVVEAVKLRLLDLLGAGLAGYRLGHQQLLLPLVSGVGQATVWGIGSEYTPRDAALLNSFLAHATYLEDGSRFTGGHPSSVVIPSALALGEDKHVSGRDLIAAIAAGYEVFLRLGRVIYPSTVVRGFQSTAVLGAVASAAACARVLEADVRVAGNSIAIASSLGTGLKEALKSARSGALQVARSCEGGMLAALLADAGVEGADTVIEAGFVKAFSDGASVAGAADGLGIDYRIFETYLKLHAGCRGNHAPTDVVQGLVRLHGVQVDEIERILVRVDSVTLAGEVAEPRTGAQAQFSIAFSLALALLDERVSIFQFTDERLADPATRAIMARVHVEADPRLDLAYPDKRGAVVEIQLRNGLRHVGTIELALGEPESPFSRADIENKFLGIAHEALGANAERVRDMALDLERLADVSLLSVRLIAGGRAAGESARARRSA